jgi:hypothetical protein
VLDNSFFINVFVLFYLWPLLVVGGIAVWLSWIYVEPEYDDGGILTRGSHCSVRARALLTAGCTVFWICGLADQALTGSPIGPNHPINFGFWPEHPVLLVTLLSLADLLLIASVAYAWHARGSGRWVLWVVTPIIAVASIAPSIFLFLSLFSDSSTSF